MGVVYGANNIISAGNRSGRSRDEEFGWLRKKRLSDDAAPNPDRAGAEPHLISTSGQGAGGGEEPTDKTSDIR